jgi:hypothetical protein
MNRRLLALALASALAVVVGAAALLLAPDPTPADTGRAPLAVDAAGPTSTESPATTAPPATAPSVPEIGVRSGRLEDLPAPGPAPVGIRVDGVGIDAPVVEMGIEEGDEGGSAVAVPEDVAVAGWYKYGPRPGEPGSAVVTAHVDSAAQGAGAFFPLRDAEEGSVVTVSYADGSEAAFEIVGRRTYPKSTLPVEELFTRTGDPVLTLITCGGAFDPVTRHYEENVVVFAEPLA